jgi:hypothetical protein
VRNPAAVAIPRTDIRCADRQWLHNTFLDAAATTTSRLRTTTT